MRDLSNPARVIVAIFVIAAIFTKSIMFPNLSGAASVALAAVMGGVAGGIASIIGLKLFPKGGRNE